MYWFVIATFSPSAMLVLASLLGGVWAWIALGFVAPFVMLMDRITFFDQTTCTDEQAQVFARRLSVTLALIHFAVLFVGLRALAVSPNLSTFQALALAMAMGLFMGQVSNSNAHELIHASDRQRRYLGIAIYISLLFGHHASAHPKVHHIHVATRNDPNSARLGQSFYAFWPRAWVGSFLAGFRAENTWRARMRRRPHWVSHPYVAYVIGAFLALGIAFAIGGARAILIYIALTSYAQMQLILADYVQHYGLRRKTDPSGKSEPARAGHSWNAPHWYSGFMMLNAPRHSDHHVNPLRHFPSLRLDPENMPILPYSLPVMAAIALIPPLWQRLMDPRVAQWQMFAAAGGEMSGDLALSADDETATDSPNPDDPDGRPDGQPDSTG